MSTKRGEGRGPGDYPESRDHHRVLRSTGEQGKASPIRGGGRTEKRTRRRDAGKIVAVWSSVSQRAWAASVRCGEPSGAKVICSSILTPPPRATIGECDEAGP